MADSAWRSVGTVACRCDGAPAWRPSSGSGWPEPPEKSDIARPTRKKRPETKVVGVDRKCFFLDEVQRRCIYRGSMVVSAFLKPFNRFS